MKKFVSACLMAGLLTCAAGAAQVGTINNNYPGDTEAQAQMLYDLGLFKGTDKGFALEKSMTRAEASVMLTRLLGAKRPRWKETGSIRLPMCRSGRTNTSAGCIRMV